MSDQQHHATDDELAPEQTAGFKVGQKKTIDEYQKLGRYPSTQTPIRLHQLGFKEAYSSLRPPAIEPANYTSPSLMFHVVMSWGLLGRVKLTCNSATHHLPSFVPTNPA